MVVVREENTMSHRAFVSYLGGCTGQCNTYVDLFGLHVRGFELVGDDILLPPITDNGQDLTINGFNQAIGELPKLDGSDASYFGWVPSFARLFPGSVIDSDCLAKKPCGQGKNVKILSRMMLNTGVLSTCTFREWQDGRVHAINFQPLEGLAAMKQAIAEVVVLEKTLDVNSITLSTGSSSVTLTPINGEVVIYVGNLPPRVPGGIADTKGKHFKFLHDLLSTAHQADLDLDTAHSVSVQPNCVAKVPMDLRSGFVVASPDSRPICPMGSFAQ